MIELISEGKADGLTLIADEVTGNSRWSAQHEVLFKHEEKLYSTSYSKGLTEMQDEQPWDYENEVECHEMEAYERTVVSYRRVRDRDDGHDPMIPPGAVLIS
jgi:hypothetical protein